MCHFQVPGLGFLPWLQAWKPVRCSHAPHVETESRCPVEQAHGGESHTQMLPFLPLERRRLRHPMKAPQKVQAGAIPDG